MLSSCLQDPVINSSKEKRTSTCTQIDAVLGRIVNITANINHYGFLRATSS